MTACLINSGLEHGNFWALIFRKVV